MINSVPTDSPIEAIIAVAHVIFGDGEIHWGRIIGLFYFAYRMCVRVSWGHRVIGQHNVDLYL